MRRGLAALLLAGVAPLHAADSGGTALDRYLTGLTSLRAAFTQRVTDAHGKQTESGGGTLLVQRPGRFRWDYQPAADPSNGGDTGAAAGGQLLVADGRNLWFFDRELSQVTVKPESTALSATPVMLLSGSPTQLHEMFDISADGTHDGMEWVRVKPRSAEGDFTEAQLGFVHDQLARMQVSDRLGQTVQMDFSHAERNAHVDAGDLQFKPPAGVDVLGTAQ